MIEDDDGNASQEVTTWLSDIEAAGRALKDWHSRCDKIRKRYRADTSRNRRKSEYQMLWANIETLKPAVFAKLPEAICSRRFRDADPVGRTAGEILERCVNFTMETGDYEPKLRQVTSDLIMYARGTARLRYEPVMVAIEPSDQLDVADMQGANAARQAEEGNAPQEVLDFEHVRLDFVARDDFIHAQARTWEEVPWVAFRVFLTRAECKKRFGAKVGKEIKLDAGPDLPDDDRKNDAAKKATIYEVWDKTNREVLWLAKGHPDILDRSEPYLKLEGFYPCPKPAYGTMTGDSLEPIPDYVYYQDQAEEINKLTNRIDALSDSLKLVGFYPSGPQGEGFPEIERAVQPGYENKMIAVKSWAAFTSGGGEKGVPIVWLPVEMVADIIEKCIALRKELIADVWELTGVSDIMRGQGESDETATGVNAKSKFGMTRLSMKQHEMARLSRDIVRMVAEIVCEHFDFGTMMKMANMPLPSSQDLAMAPPQMLAPPQMPQSAAPPAPGMGAPGSAPAPQGGPPVIPSAGGPPPLPQSAMGGQLSLASPPSNLSLGQSLERPGPSLSPSLSPNGQTSVTSDAVYAMLTDGVTRLFRIDIETDSTIASDEAQDRSDRTEFIKATTDFVTGWGQIIEAQPMMAPLACALLKFGARGFRIGRDLEQAIDETCDKLTAMASQPKPPPTPDPTEQIKLQIAQIGAQVAQIKGQAEIQDSQIQSQAEAANNQQQIMSSRLDVERAAMDHQHAVAEHSMNMEALKRQSMLPPPAASEGRPQ